MRDYKNIKYCVLWLTYRETRIMIRLKVNKKETTDKGGDDQVGGNRTIGTESRADHRWGHFDLRDGGVDHRRIQKKA